MTQYQLELTIDFGDMWGNANKTAPFVVRLSCEPLLELIADTERAYRIYELMLIARPGDVWEYVRVEVNPTKVGNATTGVAADAVTPKPGNGEAFNEFDAQFFWQWDDTPPTHEAWLTHRNSPAMQGYAKQLLAMVRHAQGRLDWNDHLKRYVVESIRAEAHPFCFYEQEKAIQKGKLSQLGDANHTPEFFKQLERMLGDKDIVSVAYRADGDYEVLRRMATAQRRRANRTGHRIDHSLLLHALVNEKVDNEIWGSKIAYFEEGLGHGDLFIQGVGMGGPSVASLIKSGFRNYPSQILSATDQGDIPEYTKSTGAGWFSYSKTEKVSRRIAMEKAEHRRSSKLGFMLSFQEVGATLFEHDMTVFFVGASITTVARTAIAAVVAEWQRAGGKVMLIVIGDQAPFIASGCKELHEPPIQEGSFDPAALEHWMRTLFRRALPWVDVIVALDAPEWAARVLAQKASNTDLVWSPWVVAWPETKGLNADYLLRDDLAVALVEAHDLAKGFRSVTL